LRGLEVHQNVCINGLWIKIGTKIPLYYYYFKASQLFEVVWDMLMRFMRIVLSSSTITRGVNEPSVILSFTAPSVIGSIYSCHAYMKYHLLSKLKLKLEKSNKK
jgi:hypothetical protein